MAKRIVLFYLLVSIFFSCKKKEVLPDGLLPKDKFESVMKDILIVDAAVVNKGEVKDVDSLLADTLYSKVLNKYDIKKEDFNRTLLYYEKNPTLLNEVMDSILAKMNQER